LYMKQWNKFILTLSVMALFCCVVSPFGGIAFGAQTAPVVTVLPVFKEGAVTPTRLASDGVGNIYVTDPHAEGVLKYNSVGKLLQKIRTAKEPGGIAFAQNGDLLVTQGTYVVALDPASGGEKARFGTFLSAFAITVDTRAAGAGGTGRIYVSDIQDYCVQVFSDTYGPLTLAAHNPAKPLNSFGASQIVNGAGPGYFNRPAGVAFEKSSGSVAVVDSLNGKVQFFNSDGNYIDEFGVVGYEINSVKFSYPQSIAFEYTASGILSRVYVLDTYQSYVMVLDGTAPYPSGWTKLSGIGSYGHANGNLIAPSDILIDTKDPDNNRLFVSNGFGSISVFGLASLQPYNVNITSITNASLTVNWSNSSTPFQWVRVYRSTVEGQLGALVSGNLASAATSFPDTSLNPYTTYYYTVRAVDYTSQETTNISQVSAKTTGDFGLTLNIVGNGQINGSVTCTGGSCLSTQPSDSLILLTASASGVSVFTGWTGDCFTTSDTCLITMDAAKFVSALFTAKLAFRVDGAYFDNLNDAYRAAQNGSVIKVMAGTWPSTTHPTEYMTAWQAKTVTIEGGYDPTFTSNAGATSTVIGRTNLNAGKVIMKQIKMK
jgi:fibronectin type III domain protein/List-Bact-rpt repeat protein